MQLPRIQPCRKCNQTPGFAVKQMWLCTPLLPAPWPSTPKGGAAEGCRGTAPCRELTGARRWPAAVQLAHVSRAAPLSAARTSTFPPSLLQHMHRGCRTGGQTMRTTQFTFEPKINDFKLQSGVKHAHSFSILRHFSNHVDRSRWSWLCSTRWFFFFSPIRGCGLCSSWTVLLWENRLGQIVYYSFLLCCHRWGARGAGLVQSVTI